MDTRRNCYPPTISNRHDYRIKKLLVYRSLSEVFSTLAVRIVVGKEFAADLLCTSEHVVRVLRPRFSLEYRTRYTRHSFHKNKFGRIPAPRSV